MYLLCYNLIPIVLNILDGCIYDDTSDDDNDGDDGDYLGDYSYHSHDAQIHDQDSDEALC